jgi:hypothetical protein
MVAPSLLDVCIVRGLLRDCPRYYDIHTVRTSLNGNAIRSVVVFVALRLIRICRFHHGHIAVLTLPSADIINFGIRW